MSNVVTTSDAKRGQTSLRPGASECPTGDAGAIYPRVDRRLVPALTVEQMREVDRAMVEDLHIALIQMMENAGRNLADCARSRFTCHRVIVACGPGGNGGGGLVAARHLFNRGVDVKVLLSHSENNLTTTTSHQLDIVRRMGIPIVSEASASDLVIDALVGYGITGDPYGRTADLINWANGVSVPILALDTPSGLDLATGHAGNPSVWAQATLTLALPKVGLLGSPHTGELYLADISVPSLVYERMGVGVPGLFEEGAIIQLCE